MSAREQLARVIVTAYGEDGNEECPCVQDFDVADMILADGWVKPRTVKFSDLGSLPIGVVVRNNEGGTIAVRESENDWFIPGLDYEIELWELENPEGEDFTVLFTPVGNP